MKKRILFKIVSVIFSMLFVLLINNNTVIAISDNYAPVNTVPGAQTTYMNQDFTFNSANGNLISVSDPDAGSGVCTVTLQVSHGTLTLNSTTGLVFTVGDGTADANITLDGTLSDMNTALNGLVYTPTTDYVGTDTLTIKTNDNGNTGIGGALEDTDTVSINIASIYDNNDFTKLQTFLNQDSSIVGKTNGQALNASYDPDDPTTWLGVTWTTTYPKKVTSIGGSLDWGNNGLAGAINLSGFTALTNVYIGDNHLTAINVSEDTALVGLYCYNNDITSITLSNNTSLEYLKCQENKIESLDASGAPNLIELFCADNKLTSLSINSCSLLEQLQCHNNNLTLLNLTNNTAIKYLICFNNQLGNLDISANTNLRNVNCSNNKLMSLNISANNTLRSLYCSDNQLSSIDFGTNDSLLYLECQNNSLTSLDLSSENNMAEFNCNNNKLKQISINIGGNGIKLTSNGCGYVALELGIIGPSSFITANASPLSGSSFTNWTSGGTEVSTLTDYALSVGTDYDLVANFTGRQVKFDSKGGTSVEGIVAEVGNKITAPTAPTKDGYTFAGWYKESALENAWDFDNDTVTSDVTLYAKWNEIVNEPEPEPDPEQPEPDPEPTNNLEGTTIPKTAENSIVWFEIGLAFVSVGAVFMLISKKRKQDR